MYQETSFVVTTSITKAKKIKLSLMKNNNNLFKKNIQLDVFSGFREDIDPVKYFIELYAEIPRTYEAYHRINLSVSVEKLKKKFKLNENDFVFKREFSKDNNIYRVDKEASAYFLNLTEGIMLLLTSYRFSFYYSSAKHFFELKDIIKILDPEEQRRVSGKARLSMILYDNSSEWGYELKRFSLNKSNLDLDKNYNNDFIPINKKITDFLNDKKSTGLILLHGKYGTGKTSYIKHLMSKTNTHFILLPKSMLATIANPSFFLFISEFKNSVLILEDCDELLVGTSVQGNPLVHFLSLAEGLLAETYSYKIICSLNASRREINDKVIRKSKLVVNYEFKELDTEKAQNLSNSFGSKDVIHRPTILADIYNKNKNTFAIAEEKKLGFN